MPYMKTRRITNPTRKRKKKTSARSNPRDACPLKPRTKRNPRNIAVTIELPNTNLRVVGAGRDTNGNAVIRFAMGANRAFSIQVGGKRAFEKAWKDIMSLSHRLGPAKVPRSQTFIREAVEYIKAHGSPAQKKSLKTYGRMKIATRRRNPTTRRSNPPVNQAWRGTDEKALKTIQGALKHAEMKSTKTYAKEILQKLKDADPTKNDARPYQFLKWLIQCFGRDPVLTLDDLSKGKRYLKLLADAQKRDTNPQWAKDPLTIKSRTSINALGAYLQQEGILQLKTQAVKDEPWLRKAYKLQEEGNAYVLLINKEVAFVDILTDKAARVLGKDTEWCTRDGAFPGYMARKEYLVVLYFRGNGHMIQFTSNFSETRDEGDNQISGWDDAPYAKWHNDAKKVAKIVTKRANILGTLPIYSAVKSIAKTGKLTQDYQWLLKTYPKFRVPPISYIQKNAKKLLDFFNAKDYRPALRRTFDGLAKASDKKILELELCYLQHPMAWDLLKPYMVMKPIPGGTHTFQDFKVHLRAFDMGKYEVTVGVWLYVMGKLRKMDTANYTNIRLPITEVSWYDCVYFCNVLSALTGLEPAYTIKGDPEAPDDVKWNWNSDGYRLPSEAEWEAAARAKGNFIYAGSNDPNEVAWYADNSGGRAHPVGGKKPNKYGLYDMSGNVWEWVYDSYSRDPKDKTEHPDFE